MYEIYCHDMLEARCVIWGSEIKTNYVVNIEI